jgi:hypothetical protein
MYYAIVGVMPAPCQTFQMSTYGKAEKVDVKTKQTKQQMALNKDLFSAINTLIKDEKNIAEECKTVNLHHESIAKWVLSDEKKKACLLVSESPFVSRAGPKSAGSASGVRGGAIREYENGAPRRSRAADVYIGMDELMTELCTWIADNNSSAINRTLTFNKVILDIRLECSGRNSATKHLICWLVPSVNRERPWKAWALGTIMELVKTIQGTIPPSFWYKEAIV